LLKPIGDHRSNTIPSKGKRSKKRKLKNVEQEQDSDPKPTNSDEKPPMPAILSFVTIGFNSMSRSLEALSQLSKPAKLQRVESDALPSKEEVSARIAAVFICRSVLPDLLIASIPLMVATASLSQPQASPIRLVQLSANAEKQLAEALYQPRVGFVGLQVDAPNAHVLLAIARAAVSPVLVPWLDGSQSPRYLPAQIDSLETSVGSKDKEKPKKAAKHLEQLPKDKSTKPASQNKVGRKPNT
jgi:ribonuclease P/MRP protein subunit POP3